jgi:argininosuccinate lyase
MTNKTTKSAIWGGRFEEGPSQVMEEINASIDFDQNLYAQDIAGSKAHCTMLMQQNIITKDDGKAILKGLDSIKQEIESGSIKFDPILEDIHMNIEARLTALIGDAAGRLHTARSRNDQVATDFKIWVRDAIDDLDATIQELQQVLIDIAEKHTETILPGMTHLQLAQPISLGHHMLAYVEMFGRDRSRLADCRKRLNTCPLGSGALAGTAFPIDRKATATELGFDGPSANSLDSVSDRDFAIEFLSGGSLLAVHLSRMAEEIVLWCTVQFGFVRLSDSFSTGSSMMPQKRNPDAAELVRGKTGRVIGALNSLLVTLKGLPLAYSKDMQEDKEPVFDAAKTLKVCLLAMQGMLEGAEFNTAAMKAAAEQGYMTATDFADWLVRDQGMPFREAHHVAGELVKRAEANNCRLDQLSLDEIKSIAPQATDEVYSILSAENSVNSRNSEGGTAPANVKKAVAEARRKFLK